MTKEDFKARVSMAYEGREQWEAFLNRVWSIHISELPHWISVKEGLPENGQRVLFSDKEDNIWAGVYIAHDDYGFCSPVTWCDTHTIHHDITHWMHLPKNPILSNSENIGKNEKGGEV